MLLHQGQGVGLVLQEQNVAQLVDLVEADGLDVDELGEVGDVVGAGCHDAHAGTGEGDLAGGGELVDHVGIAVLRAQADDVGEFHIVAVELVDAVGVVPHEHKVGGGGLHLRQTVDGRGGVDHAFGVGVLGDIPHTLDGGVLDEGLYLIHVGAVGGHGDGDHLYAEALGDLEVAVIAGNGADPLDLVQLAPGLFAVEQTVGESLGYGVVHQLQAGVAAHEHLLRLAAQNVGKQPSGRGNTRHLAVVADVDAVGDEILRLRQQTENGCDQVQLGLAGLAPGHIQAEAHGLELFVFHLHGGVFGLTLLKAHICIFLHCKFLRFLVFHADFLRIILHYLHKNCNHNL